MMPALLPGDCALAVPVRRPRVGHIVVVEHPDKPGYEMVKRIIAGPGDHVRERVLDPDEWWIEGDHAGSSTDSRRFGPVARDALKARVRLIYWPNDRRRLL